MARKAAKHNPDGPPDFCDYGVGVLAERLDKMLAHTEGAASGYQTRPIHQMRVWSRRSRAALDVFSVCFVHEEPEAFAGIVQEVKTVTRALGAARDLDVMLETLRTRMESLPPEQQGGVDSFLDYLQAQRNDRQQAVTSAIKHLEKRNLKQQLHRLADRQGYKAITIELQSVPEPPTPETAEAQTAPEHAPSTLAAPEPTGLQATVVEPSEAKPSGAEAAETEPAKTAKQLEQAKGKAN